MSDSHTAASSSEVKDAAPSSSRLVNDRTAAANAASTESVSGGALAMKVTDCECTAPGWCARHQYEKSRTSFEHCRRRPDFFAAWERGQLREQHQTVATANLRSESCQHRGAETRRMACETCQGHVQLKVFHCTKHGECTLGRTVTGVVSCVTCSDFSLVTPDG